MKMFKNLFFCLALTIAFGLTNSMRAAGEPVTMESLNDQIASAYVSYILGEVKDKALKIKTEINTAEKREQALTQAQDWKRMLEENRDKEGVKPATKKVVEDALSILQEYIKNLNAVLLLVIPD